MRDLEQARLMVAMANKEVKALTGMMDEAVFATEIFGFHAQQAVEKTLKAWLALTGVEYPRPHDLQALFDMLAEGPQHIPPSFRRLEFLTDFAVQFRYTAFEDLSLDLDRGTVTRQAAALIDHLARLIEGTEAAP